MVPSGSITSFLIMACSSSRVSDPRWASFVRAVIFVLNSNFERKMSGLSVENEFSEERDSVSAARE